MKKISLFLFLHCKVTTENLRCQAKCFLTYNSKFVNLIGQKLHSD